MLQLWVISWSH